PEPKADGRADEPIVPTEQAPGGLPAPEGWRLGGGEGQLPSSPSTVARDGRPAAVRPSSGWLRRRLASTVSRSSRWIRLYSCTACATNGTAPSSSSGYSGSETASRASRSLVGKAPAVYPRSPKAG